MSDSKNRPPATLARVSRGAIVCLAAGAVVFLLGVILDWGGLWGGFGLGAGIGLIVVGTYFWGFANGIRRAGSRAVWLPSEDAHG